MKEEKIFCRIFQLFAHFLQSLAFLYVLNEIMFHLKI